MNLLEHYILKVHIKTDVTEEYKEKTGTVPHEKLLKVDMDIDCYGRKERVTEMFFESEWKEARENGYYMA